MKILVIDDHALVREGLRQVLKGLDENVDVLQAGTCEQAFALAQSHLDLDLALLDYHLPDMTGLQALDIFAERHPELPIVMLSGSANYQIMQQVLKSGAAGFINKSSLSDELLRAVRQVLDGNVYWPEDRQQGPLTVPNENPNPKSTLTQRQELVLQGLLDGQSNREIGKSLSLSEETIKTHVTSILRHFEVQNRTQAVVAAARKGYKPRETS
ncbi:response regulator transcription factor [Rhodoferax saidenbachensis]|uniref:DNA-binding response regulator n=1 Tax=Rhodoferax saidenbachensis TaxID=1484693 RepID=A0A1P8K8U4_9BURK|nr:response regulator transcription factor [Rhodoferax saidenbachensis]APW42400.1 DNA-binding response regulator [Rhodoferax saidenbachensis]